MSQGVRLLGTALVLTVILSSVNIALRRSGLVLGLAGVLLSLGVAAGGLPPDLPTGLAPEGRIAWADV